MIRGLELVDGEWKARVNAYRLVSYDGWSATFRRMEKCQGLGEDRSMYNVLLEYDHCSDGSGGTIGLKVRIPAPFRLKDIGDETDLARSRLYEMAKELLMG